MYDTLIKLSSDRDKYDYYATSPEAVEELLKREKFKEIVYEPACGEGHIGKVLEKYGYKVKATDIVYRGYGSEQTQDFFEIKENELDILTNPPYFCADKFLYHALKISNKGVKVAMLFRLAFLEGRKRYELFKEYPPKTVYVFSKRIKCYKNGDLSSNKNSNGIAFAWFVWEIGYEGETIIKWIN